MRRPEVAATADVWTFQWSEQPELYVELAHPKENGFGIYAEMTIEWRNGSERPGHIHWSRVRISDAEDRERLSRTLAKRTSQGPASLVEWPSVLEQASVLCVRSWRKGEPIVDLAGVDAPRQLQYLRAPLLPLGETSLIYADGASGKSMTALLLALSVRAGVQLPGLQSSGHTGDVLYLDWETHQTAHARRLEALCRGFGLPRPPLFYLRMSQPLLTSLPRIQREVAERRITFLIVDSVGFAASGNINDPQVATDTYNGIRSLGVSTLALHHVNKDTAAQDNGTGKPFGAAYWWNGARSAWELRSRGSENELVVSFWHRKENDGGRLAKPFGWVFNFDNAQGITTVRGHDVGDDPELAGFGGTGFLLERALRFGAKTVSQLADETDLTKDQVKKALQRGGQFRRLAGGSVGRGRESLWGLAQPENGTSPNGRPVFSEAPADWDDVPF